MAYYSVESRDQTFVKNYRFLSFSKNMSKFIGKNLSENLSNKYCQKLLDHTKKPAIDAIKTVSKKWIKKIAEATGDLAGNKIADKITKYSSQNNSDIRTRRKINRNNKKNIYPLNKDSRLLITWD